MDAWFNHQINVPAKFSYGRNHEGFRGTSDIERYIENYDKAWWRVMRQFSTSDDWASNIGPSVCSGTEAASQGCADGFKAAVERLCFLINEHSDKNIRAAILARLEPKI